MIGQSEAVHCFVSGDEIFNIRAWQLTENSGRAKHWKIKLVVARQFRGVLSGVSGRGGLNPGSLIYSIIVFAWELPSGPAQPVRQ